MIKVPVKYYVNEGGYLTVEYTDESTRILYAYNGEITADSGGDSGDDSPGGIK